MGVAGAFPVTWKPWWRMRMLHRYDRDLLSSWELISIVYMHTTGVHAVIPSQLIHRGIYYRLTNPFTQTESVQHQVMNAWLQCTQRWVHTLGSSIRLQEGHGHARHAVVRAVSPLPDIQASTLVSTKHRVLHFPLSPWVFSIQREWNGMQCHAELKNRNPSPSYTQSWRLPSPMPVCSVVWVRSKPVPRNTIKELYCSHQVMRVF